MRRVGGERRRRKEDLSPESPTQPESGEKPIRREKRARRAAQEEKNYWVLLPNIQKPRKILNSVPSHPIPSLSSYIVPSVPASPAHTVKLGGEGGQVAPASLVPIGRARIPYRRHGAKSTLVFTIHPFHGCHSSLPSGLRPRLPSSPSSQHPESLHRLDRLDRQSFPSCRACLAVSRCGKECQVRPLARGIT